MPTAFENELLARCTFPEPSTTVTCAVSGGADSVALLILATAAGCEVTAMHVDHGLREGSHEEAELVRQVAQQFSAGFETRSVNVEPGPNIEARARAARYAVLPDDVLTGHTADDQAETVIMNLMRGASLDGLAGMRVAQHPILKLRRAETRQLCEDHGIQPFHDPSNDDKSLLRNRVRGQLIPQLNDLASRDVVEVVARAAELIRIDTDYLNLVAQSVDVTDAKALKDTPVAIARRAVRLWLRQYLDDEAHPPDAAGVERVLAVARGDAVACELSGGWRVQRSAQRLSVIRIH